MPALITRIGTDHQPHEAGNRPLSVIRLRPLLLLLALCHSLPSAAAPSLMRLERLQGSGEVVNGPSRDELVEGVELQAGDELQLAPGSRASLTLGRNGVLELGPGASIRIELLPFASFSDDLRTVLRLQGGYLRVIWKQRPWDVDWPLAIELGADRANLKTGEYYFALDAAKAASVGAATACVAEGQIALSWNNAAGSRLLEMGACYRRHDNSLEVSAPLSEPDWVAMRLDQRIAVMASPESVAAESEPVAVNPPIAADSPAAPALVVEAAPRLPAEAPADPVESSATYLPTPYVELEPAPEPDLAMPSETEAPTLAAPAAAQTSDQPVPVAKPAGWAVNLASFPERAPAQKELLRLQRAGFDGAIQETRIKNRLWYRVQIQGLASRDQANSLLGRLKDRGFPAAWVVAP